MKLPSSIKILIEELNKLPSIGLKTAQRLAFYLLHQKKSDLTSLGESIVKLKDGLVFCSKCQNISETHVCAICSDDSRDFSIICVVSEPLDIIALEKPGIFSGVYHVLQGVISPLEGISPEDLKIAELMERVKNDSPKEIILATNPSMEGEATALYIQRKLADFPVKITRLARGLPVGGDIEYADEVTLSNALKGRSEY